MVKIRTTPPPPSVGRKKLFQILLFCISFGAIQRGERQTITAPRSFPILTGYNPAKTYISARPYLVKISWSISSNSWSPSTLGGAAETSGRTALLYRTNLNLIDEQSVDPRSILFVNCDEPRTRPSGPAAGAGARRLPVERLERRGGLVRLRRDPVEPRTGAVAQLLPEGAGAEQQEGLLRRHRAEKCCFVHVLCRRRTVCRESRLS